MMKQLRRIELTPPTDTYAKAQRGLLRHVAISDAQFRELERRRPGLVSVDGDAVLIGWPASGAINLQYAYPSHDAFAGRFPAMLQRLLPAIDSGEAPIGVCLRLTERSVRTYIEPVLAANAFELIREWWHMSLPALPEGVDLADQLAPGFLLRPARREDAEAIVELDAVAFVIPSLTPAVAREQIERAPMLRVLEDTARGRAIGYLQLGIHPAATGYVSELAVHPDHQRRGLGEAMLRWALAWFRSQGLTSAALQVNTDNAPAIALYRKLGFTAGEIGLDYRRPIDEDEVRQVLERHRAQHITVRRRS
jgi:ribosomal protein S18 acetylase RimI-like enzyme